METTGSPRFLVDPMCRCFALRPRWSLHASPTYGVSVLLPNIFTPATIHDQFCFRGSMTRPVHSLCTLRRRSHPRSTQHSVPAGGYPLPGRLSCWVPLKVSAQPASSFSRLRLAHKNLKRPTARSLVIARRSAAAPMSALGKPKDAPRRSPAAQTRCRSDQFERGLIFAIARSAIAVIVSDGFTPGFADTAAPSITYKPG